MSPIPARRTGRSAGAARCVNAPWEPCEARRGLDDRRSQASEWGHRTAGHGTDDISVGSPPMLPPAVAHTHTTSRCGAPSMSATLGIGRLRTDNRAQQSVRDRSTDARPAHGPGGLTHQAPGGLAHLLTIGRRAHAHRRRDATVRASASAVHPAASAPSARTALSATSRASTRPSARETQHGSPQRLEQWQIWQEEQLTAQTAAGGRRRLSENNTDASANVSVSALQVRRQPLLRTIDDH